MVHRPQADNGLLSWAKPLKVSDDWIIGGNSESPKPQPVSLPPQQPQQLAMAMEGPKPPNPVVQSPAPAEKPEPAPAPKAAAKPTKAQPKKPVSVRDKTAWIISDPAPDSAQQKADESKDDDDKDSDKKEEGPSQPERKTRIAWDQSFGMNNQNSMTYNVGLTASGNRSLEQSGARFHVEGQVQAPCCIGKNPKGGPIQTQYSGAVTVGYEWIGEKGSFAAYLGMNMQNAAKYMLEVSGSGIGLQASADFSFNPTERFMLSASGTYSTLNSAYYSRAKMGVAIFEGVYVGPEVTFLGEKVSRQTRYGAFISGISIRNLQFGLSGGYVIDPKRGNGAYAMLDLRTTFW